MLDEAQALRAGGADIVIAYFEAHGRRDTIAKTEGLETIPRRIVSYGGSQFEELDTEAVLRRMPAVALVDEFAHTNVPGAGRDKRWQDVRVMLDAGIDVLTTMNVQHLESLNDQVWRVTGVRVRETVPDWVVDEAGEAVFADLTPRALRNRIERGVVYAPEKARRERILICLTGSPSSAILIRRGKRMADYLQADCLAVHVSGPAGREREAVERHMSFARNLRIDTHVVDGPDVAAAITGIARSRL